MKPVWLGVIASLGLWQLAEASSASVQICPLQSGLYVGAYSDPTGLFPPQAFPMRLYIKVQGTKLYGYTLKAADQKGPAYGRSPYASFWATCQNQQINQVYLVKNNAKVCGIPASGPWPIVSSQPLQFQVEYENAMISAGLDLELHFDHSMQANVSRLKRVMKLSQSGLSSCT